MRLLCEILAPAFSITSDDHDVPWVLWKSYTCITSVWFLWFLEDSAHDARAQYVCSGAWEHDRIFKANWLIPPFCWQHNYCHCAIECSQCVIWNYLPTYNYVLSVLGRENCLFLIPLLDLGLLVATAGFRYGQQRCFPEGFILLIYTKDQLRIQIFYYFQPSTIDARIKRTFLLAENTISKDFSVCLVSVPSLYNIYLLLQTHFFDFDSIKNSTP